MNTLEKHKQQNLARRMAAWLACAPMLFGLAAAGMPFARAQGSAPPAQSAGEPAAITGRVLDDNTKEYIKNATVTIAPPRREVITDDMGMFRFSGLRPGSYMLEISYGEMKLEKRTVTVAAGETKTIEVPMTSDLYIMEKFVVAGEREGQQKMLAEQRLSDTSKYMVSAENFGNIPDGNIGEVLKTIPGVTVFEWMGEPVSISIRGGDANSAVAMIDGNQLASSERNGNGISTGGFALTGFNADNVEYIEVAKAAAPSSPANSSGGMVNFRTRSAFKQKGRRVSLAAYTNINEDYMSLGPSASNRSNPTRKIYPGFSIFYTESFGRVHPIGVSLTASYNKFIKSTQRYILNETRIPGLPSGQNSSPADNTVAGSLTWDDNTFITYSF
jgi:hypothetical protein